MFPFENGMHQKKPEGAKSEGKEGEMLASSGAFVIWNWCPYQEIKLSSLSH